MREAESIAYFSVSRHPSVGSVILLHLIFIFDHYLTCFAFLSSVQPSDFKRNFGSRNTGFAGLVHVFTGPDTTLQRDLDESVILTQSLVLVLIGDDRKAAICARDARLCLRPA
jgi:hypothetical protein